MPTVRRLINKKAYEEMVLIKGLVRTSGYKWDIVIELDRDERERFAVYEGCEKKFVGYNYTKLMKEISEYIVKMSRVEVNNR